MLSARDTRHTLLTVSDRPMVCYRNANPCPFPSPKPEDFRVWESDTPILPQVTRDQAGQRTVPPPLCGWLFYRPFHTPLLPLDHLTPDSLMCFLSLGLLYPGAVCLNFSNSPMPQWKVAHSRNDPCHRWRPISRPRRHRPTRISPLLPQKSLPTTQHLS